MVGTSAISILEESTNPEAQNQVSVDKVAVILHTVRDTAPGEWKVLVVDEGSRKLVDSAVKEDDILELNVTNIEQIEDRRPMNKDMDAVFLLSPLPHIVDCLMADFERRRYRRSFLIWTSVLPPEHRSRLDNSAMAREQIAGFRVLNIDFFPRESHLITFRDPWSFPMLFHPACNQLVRKHMDDLAQKIVSICVSLGEYPIIRYHSPRNATHEASVLCSHLARFVQAELDRYAQHNHEFPPVSNRPRGALFITDRSMDLFAPVLHEFTYQAMIHDLLPIMEGDKVFYKNANKDEANGATKDSEISEKDKIWVANRHLHMKDLLEKLVNDFNKFRADNPQFEENAAEGQSSIGSINNIKDMLAGLPQFQAGKEAYALHLGMAQDAMDTFQARRLGDIASVEQSLATGLDEDYKKPKNLADQVVRLLDDEGVTVPDRLRIIIQYILYRDGLLPSDTQKLLAHAGLPAQDGEVIHNLDLLGARITRVLRDPRPLAPTRASRTKPPPPDSDDSGLSRYDPALKTMLEDHIRGQLDQINFPFTKPHLDASEGLAGTDTQAQSSLRSAKPTWARTRPSTREPRQRIIVFMAGGATYSEARSCYEVSEAMNKDVFLASSHMLTPGLFLRQVGDLSVDRRKLNLPAERPKPRAPDHLFEKEKPPAPPPNQPSASGLPQGSRLAPQPPVAGMASLNVGGGHPNGLPPNQQLPTPPQSSAGSFSGKLGKEKDPEKKKKHHFFGSRKDR